MAVLTIDCGQVEEKKPDESRMMHRCLGCINKQRIVESDGGNPSENWVWRGK